MARPKLKYLATMYTVAQASQILGINPPQLCRRLESKIFPQPTVVDENHTRYFSKLWIQEARDALEREKDPASWFANQNTPLQEVSIG